MLINTSRGAVIDTPAVIAALKEGRLGHLGLDVYEEEADLFFEDLSDKVIQDDVFARLLSFPNVLVTGHQAFFTADALHGIAGTTIANIYRPSSRTAGPSTRFRSRSSPDAGRAPGKRGQARRPRRSRRSAAG